MKIRHIGIAALMAVIGVVGCNLPLVAAVPEYVPVVVKVYPHDPDAFTEGLLYYKGHLYEATGLKGRSSIREVDLKTGKVMRQRDLSPDYFGEGIVIWKDQLIGLTWKAQTGFVYSLTTFRTRSRFHYAGEGWSLTQDGRRLIMSDGTDDLRLLDPGKLTQIGRIHVTCDGHEVQRINELEWVKGEIYANIWPTNYIVRIDPVTGHVVGLIDLTDLAAATVTEQGDNVPNGIAYDAATDRLFVTGKLWPALYQVSLVRRQTMANVCDILH